MSGGQAPKLRARVVSVRALTSGQRAAMWALFRAYYADVQEATFFADLDRKDDVILLSDARDGALCGFSTLVTYAGHEEGRAFRAVFSGDTVIDARYWGQRALQRAFIRYLAWQKLKAPHLPLLWLLITKGYKTYLLMTRNFPDHWPSCRRPTPAWQAQVMASLSERLFGSAWRPALGIVRYDQPLCRLREGVAPLDPALVASDPDVRFFAARNPGHAQGDELVCLAAFGWRSAWHFIKRQVVRRPRPRPDASSPPPP